jgi:uncharacterized protein YjbK
MARKGREAMAKRAREVAKAQKQALKQEKRQARAEEDVPVQVDEEALMEEFARLAELRSEDRITDDDFESERVRIFTELGIIRSEEE